MSKPYVMFYTGKRRRYFCVAKNRSRMYLNNDRLIKNLLKGLSAMKGFCVAKTGIA